MTKKNEQYQYAFIDSGTGGLPYLQYLHELEPDASMVYVADNAHFPYGKKTKEEVIAFASETVEKLIARFNPEIIIVACNTMSVMALDSLRKKFTLPFVGTVPGIKLAVKQSRNKRIGILATERTVCDPYTERLIEEFGSGCYFEKRADQELIAQIEDGLITDSYEEKLKAIQPALEQFKKANTDSIILACTHFLHIEDVFESAAGSDMQIIDTRSGVIHQALRIAPCKKNPDAPPNSCYATAALDTHIEEQYRMYSKLFQLRWGGTL
ncbi:glutamate racemase [Treponema phagedenis]|uniref:glutamate racemase n=1 Tax=Treponema phagedenis TaxID=162 RepID=UPI0011E85AD5|nr:glutamate racemase [Treponema phagedenis]QEK06362.1 glutamate racemase [Treponema phagedenis]